MSDDQDGCEWVSFLLVPAYPGSPGLTAVKRLCVCVVCVCIPNGQLWTLTAVMKVFHLSLLQHPKPLFLHVLHTHTHTHFTSLQFKSHYSCRLLIACQNNISFHIVQASLVECYSNHIITRISIQTTGLAFGGTGLCSYRVRGVDGICAQHLTVESYTAFVCQQSYLLLSP